MPIMIIQSPIGTLAIESYAKNIVRIDVIKNIILNKPDAVTKHCAKELAEYFSGKRKDFSIPFKANGTPFQKAVWQAMQRIPYGEMKTYSEIAITIGKPKAVRAVGTACGKNPLLVVIPCHRITAKNGLGGYAAGITKKKWLLAHEKNE